MEVKDSFRLYIEEDGALKRPVDVLGSPQKFGRVLHEEPQRVYVYVGGVLFRFSIENGRLVLRFAPSPYPYICGAGNPTYGGLLSPVELEFAKYLPYIRYALCTGGDWRLLAEYNYVRTDDDHVSFYVYLVDKYGNPALFEVSLGDGDDILCFTEVENPSNVHALSLPDDMLFS